MIAIARPEQLRVRLGEWDVHSDTETYSNIEMNVDSSRDQIIRNTHSKGRIEGFWPTDSISFDKFLLAEAFKLILFVQILMPNSPPPLPFW